MYQELQSKVTEEKPSYRLEEIQWLLEHLGAVSYTHLTLPTTSRV